MVIMVINQSLHLSLYQKEQRINLMMPRELMLRINLYYLNHCQIQMPHPVDYLPPNQMQAPIIININKLILTPNRDYVY